MVMVQGSCRDVLRGDMNEVVHKKVGARCSCRLGLKIELGMLCSADLGPLI
jgi:hypothetical protein